MRVDLQRLKRDSAIRAGQRSLRQPSQPPSRTGSRHSRSPIVGAQPAPPSVASAASAADPENAAWIGWAGGAVAVVALAAAGVIVWQRTQAKPLTDKDVLVWRTSPTPPATRSLTCTLREALAVQLEQSPFLKILGDEQVRQDLRLMGRPAGERITNQIAREICQREGEKAMIGGSIASLGKTYAITLQATNCQTGGC